MGAPVAIDRSSTANDYDSMDDEIIIYGKIIRKDSNLGTIKFSWR